MEQINAEKMYGPLNHEEWVYLIGEFAALNVAYPTAGKLELLLDKLCDPIGIDWREAFSQSELME